MIAASYDSMLASADFNQGFKNYKSGAFVLMNIMKYLKDYVTNQ